MPEPPFIKAMTLSPMARHAVVVRVPMHGDDLLLPLRDLKNVLIRYLRKQSPESDHSIQIMRQDGVPEVHCFFAECAAAQRLAAALHGVSCPVNEAELSNHLVELDDEILLEILQVAGPPSLKRARRDDSESGGPVRSVTAMRWR